MMTHTLTNAYTEANAYHLAKLAGIAYTKAPDTLRMLCRLQGYDECKAISEGGTECIVTWKAEGGPVVVAFRGTEPWNLQDLLTDAKVGLTEWAAGKVHRGFAAAWDKVERAVLQLVGKLGNRPVYVTGHSLGGALATLAAARLNVISYVAGVYTYGSPRVGDADFSRHYNSMLGKWTYRFRNNNDVVTKVPLALPQWVVKPLQWFSRLPYVPGGYRHVGKLKYFYSDGELVCDPPLWLRAIDAVDGRIKDLGTLGTDGFKDHSMLRYVELCKSAARA